MPLLAPVTSAVFFCRCCSQSCLDLVLAPVRRSKTDRVAVRYRSGMTPGRAAYSRRRGDPRAALLRRRRRGVARRPGRRATRDGPAAAVAGDRPARTAPRRRPVRPYAAGRDAHRAPARRCCARAGRRSPRSRRPSGAPAGPPQAAGRASVVLTAKAGASSELMAKLLDAYAAEPDAVDVEVVLSPPGHQAPMLRDGRADVAILHRPFDDTERVRRGRAAGRGAGADPARRPPGEHAGPR